MLGALLTIPCAAPRNCFIFHVSVTGFFATRSWCSCKMLRAGRFREQTSADSWRATSWARRRSDCLHTDLKSRTNGLVDISFIASQFIMSTLDDKYFLIETKSKIDSRNGSLYDCCATGKITVLRRPLMNSNDRKQ